MTKAVFTTVNGYPKPALGGPQGELLPSGAACYNLGHNPIYLFLEKN